MLLLDNSRDSKLSIFPFSGDHSMKQEEDGSGGELKAQKQPNNSTISWEIASSTITVLIIWFGFGVLQRETGIQATTKLTLLDTIVIQVHTTMAAPRICGINSDQSQTLKRWSHSLRMDLFPTLMNAGIKAPLGYISFHGTISSNNKMMINISRILIIIGEL